MESSPGPLLPLFERERAAGRPVVLGVLVETLGSTYRKPGAMMLIASSGEYAGLLSGGCLEGDLRERARSVFETGVPSIASYDLRGPDDLLWGLGLGCEGAMKILLLRAGADNAWQPLAHLASAFAEHRPTAVGLVAESASAELKAGAVIVPGEGPADQVHSAITAAARDTGVGWIDFKPHQARIFVLPLALPPRFLLLGAGPDAAPVVDFAAKLGWKITIADHRPAYAVAARFPAAERVVLSRPEALAESLDLGTFSAAVVMSHHLPSDLNYLRVLAGTTIPYIGLLGPAARREKLFSELGSEADRLRSRLHAPVGLALGGRAPESVALAIVAEVHAFLHGKHGGAFSKE